MTPSAALAPAEVEARAERWKRGGIAAGNRLILLLLIGLVWIAPAFRDRRFLFGMLAWDGLVLVAWAVDLARLPRSDRLVVRRRWLGPLSLSVEQRLEITVANESPTSLSLTVIDEVPTDLRSQPPELTITVFRHAEGAAAYSVEPTRRGDVNCGFAYVHYRSALGLAEKWARADLQQEVRVYPNLKEAEQHSIYLMRSRQIEMERRYVHLRGEGREFENLRDYQEGDDLRDVCWTASARRGKPITKVYQIERSQPVWIVVDCGRLMRTRVGSVSKLDSAANAALSLAQVAIFSGDRVGLLTYGRAVRGFTPLGRGSSHLRYIVEQLATAREEVPEADHLRATSALLSRQRRRSLIVWLTDLAETAMTPEVIQGAMELVPQHLLLFVVISQPDLRAKAASLPKNQEQMFETAAAQELVHRRELLLARVREKGALAVEADWRSLSTLLINQYLNLKERGRI